jgi:hypothetical protein
MAHVNADIAEFQRRRRLWMRRGVPFLALFFAAGIAGAATGHFKYAFYAGLGCFVGWSYFTWRLYRCPRCNKIPGADGDVALNPRHCRHCGIQLRADTGA